MANQVYIIRNDVIPDLRTVSERAFRQLIRSNLLSIGIQSYHAVQAGEAATNPTKLIWQVIANDENMQLDIVRAGSYLTEQQIQQLQPSALLAACIEVYHFAECVYGNERLGQILLDELWMYLPGLPQSAIA